MNNVIILKTKSGHNLGIAILITILFSKIISAILQTFSKAAGYKKVLYNTEDKFQEKYKCLFCPFVCTICMLGLGSRLSDKLFLRLIE